MSFETQKLGYFSSQHDELFDNGHVGVDAAAVEGFLHGLSGSRDSAELHDREVVGVLEGDERLIVLVILL